jgi:hypothetical protein
MRTKFAIEYIREHKGNRTEEIISALNSKFLSIDQFELRFETLCCNIAQDKGMLVEFYIDNESRQVASFIEKCRPI